MPGQVKLIDDKVKEDVLRYPMVELIRKLFPEVKMRGRSVLCNPLRNDKHPSLSCFRDYMGFQRWKDHATGETGDNLDFFRKVYPELGFVEALDRLSLLVLGRSAIMDYSSKEVSRSYAPARRKRPVHVEQAQEASSLNVISVKSYDVSVPKHLVDYTRGRGISDEVAGRYLNYVVYENLKRKGRSLIDSVSGLPVLDSKGEIVRDEARFEAVGMRNDIGGYSLRVPADGQGVGFKGANYSFITTILAGDNRVRETVSFFGKGDGLVVKPFFDSRTGNLWVNGTQGFAGVAPWASGAACLFVDKWSGRYLEGRELKGVTSVLNSLNGPLSSEVDVVEGLFDAVSDIEFERLAGRGPKPARDLVVLNSISNLHWAVPFLSLHGKVRSLLDNDMRSAAGKKAFDTLKLEVEEFGSRLGHGCSVLSDSSVFYPYKDINDYLMAVKGFVKPKEPPEASKKTRPSKPLVAKAARSGKKSQVKP